MRTAKASFVWVVVSLVLMAAAVTLAVGAHPAKALRIVVVQTDDIDAYVNQIEVGKAILKRLETSAQIRVWRARFAGPQTGTVIVSVEYPSMAALAADEAKAMADAEYAAWLKGLDKIRKVVADSIYNEMMP